MKEVCYGYIHSGEKQATCALRGEANVYSQISNGICRAAFNNKKHIVRKESKPRNCHLEDALRRNGDKHSGIFQHHGI